jgi:hypothetical protein
MSVPDWAKVRASKGLVRVVGIEPTLPCGNQILHPTMAFATLASAVIRLGGFDGLDFIFTVGLRR